MLLIECALPPRLCKVLNLFCGRQAKKRIETADCVWFQPLFPEIAGTVAIFFFKGIIKSGPVGVPAGIHRFLYGSMRLQQKAEGRCEPYLLHVLPVAGVVKLPEELLQRGVADAELPGNACGMQVGRQMLPDIHFYSVEPVPVAGKFYRVLALHGGIQLGGI